MLHKSHRIGKKTFTTLFRSGRRTHTPEMTIIVMPIKTPDIQFGVVVGKSIDKRAVIRNRIKRLIRIACIHLTPSIAPGHAINIIIKKNIANVKPPSVEALLRDVFHKATITS